jgi:hypothetical protein
VKLLHTTIVKHTKEYCEVSSQLKQGKYKYRLIPTLSSKNDKRGEKNCKFYKMVYLYPNEENEYYNLCSPLNIPLISNYSNN